MKDILIIIIVSLISSTSFYIFLNSYSHNSSIKRNENNIILSNTWSNKITDIWDYIWYYSMEFEPWYEWEFTVKISDDINSKTNWKIDFSWIKWGPWYNNWRIIWKITLNNWEIEYNKENTEWICHFVWKLNWNKLKITMLEWDDSICELWAWVYPDWEYIKKSWAKPIIDLSENLVE